MSNTSKLSVILGVEGVEKVIQDTNRAKDSLNKNLTAIDNSGAQAAAGLKRVESAAASLAVQSAGLQGPLGQMAKSLMAFGPQGWVTVAVVLGIAAINSSINKHKKELENATTAAQKHRDALLDLEVIQGTNTSEDIAVERAQLAVDAIDTKIMWYKKKHPNGIDVFGKGYNIELATLERSLQEAQDTLAIAQAKKDAMRKKENDDIVEANNKRDEANQTAADKDISRQQAMGAAEFKRIHEEQVARIDAINAIHEAQLASQKSYLKAQDDMQRAQDDLNVALGNLTPQEARLNAAQRELDKANQLLAVMQQLNSIGLTSETQVGAAQLGQQSATMGVSAAEADIAAQKARDYAEQQKENLKGIQEYTERATMAWGLYWSAVGGGRNIFGSILAAAAKALSKTAALEAAKNSALAVSETATGASMAAIGNLAGAALMFKAAAGHTSAATMWGALSVGAGVAGAAAGSIGSGGGGSSGGGRSSVNTTVNNTQRPSTQITIVGDRYLDTTNPDKMDAFVRAIREAGDGNIVIRGA